MDIDQITPLILTRDEEANIERTLRQLAWAEDVLVVDSFSTDATAGIAKRFPNVRVVQREIDTLAGQTNWALQQVRTPWVLLLDADYFVPAEFADELRTLNVPAGTRAFRGPFRYAINGRVLRGSLYPPRVVLMHRDHSKMWQDGHAHRVVVDGDIGDLKTPIVHDDRKNFARFVARQKVYMRQEAEKLRTTDLRALNLASRVRKLIFVAPFAVLVQTLFAKGLILDGRAGLWYAWERFVAELILSRELLRRA